MVKSGFRGIARRDPGGYGENRMLGSVSVRRNAVAEVVGRQPDPEKRLHTHRVNIAMRKGGRGRGSSLQQPGVRRESELSGSASKRADEGRVVAETHVTAITRSAAIHARA